MTKPRYRVKAKSIPATDHPLFYPDDDPLIYELIKELIARKRFIQRPSPHHLKHRKANYYPSTEVITIDGRGRHLETGPDAFLALLDQLYPKQPFKNRDPLERDLDEPRPSPILVSEISLDEDDLNNTSDIHENDDEASG
jgi:hypothetical protein